MIISFSTYGQTYTASWASAGHSQYWVQRSWNNKKWQTIGIVYGVVYDQNYSYPIPGPGAYYRIKADAQVTKSILVNSYTKRKKKW